MSRNSSDFTIDYTNMQKGVALLFLLCNHFCVVPNWITPPSQLIDVVIHGKPLLGYVGAFGKICVAIWAFLSGIGAYHSYQKNILPTYKSNIIRLMNLMIQYVLILAILFIPVIAFFRPTFMGESYDLSVRHIIYNIFACDAEYNKAAWYMRFYIMFVLSFPLLVAIKRLVKYNTLFYIGIFLFFLCIPKTFYFIEEGTMFGSIPLRQILGEYCNYILIAMTGYMIAEYRVLENVQTRLKPRWNIVCSIALLIFAMALRSLSKSISLCLFSIYTDIVITPFVVYAFFVFFQRSSEKIKKLFTYMGKRSMVVWLVHWIFNVGVPQIQMIAYLPRISYLVILWVLIMCLAFNFVFTTLIRKSNILIKI